jgi:hypothetical protein
MMKGTYSELAPKNSPIQILGIMTTRQGATIKIGAEMPQDLFNIVRMLQRGLGKVGNSGWREHKFDESRARLGAERFKRRGSGRR